MNHLKTTKAKGNFKAALKEIKQENKHAASKTSKSKTPILIDHKILAERNQAIMPVGAWVESGIDCKEHPVVSTLVQVVYIEYGICTFFDLHQLAGVRFSIGH